MPKETKAPAKNEEVKKSCFVIAPIGDEGSDERKKSDYVVEYLIRQPLAELDYDAKRADDINQPGSITVQVIDRIIKADLVVADLSGGNPNVFYELAIRDAYRKPSVLIYDNDDEGKLPFDVSQMRAVIYSHLDHGLWETAKDKIVEHVRSIDRGETTPTVLDQVEMIHRAEGGASVEKLLGEILRTLTMVKVDAGASAKYANQELLRPIIRQFSRTGSPMDKILRPPGTSLRDMMTVSDSPVPPAKVEPPDSE